MSTPEHPDDEPDPELLPFLEPAASSDWLVLGSMGMGVVVIALFIAFCWWRAHEGFA